MTRGVLLLAIVLATAAGCGAEEPARSQEQEQPGPAMLVVEGSVTDPTGIAERLLEFGTLVIGESKTATLTVRNVGASATTLTTRGLAAPFVSSFEEPITLEPGAAHKLHIRFAPREAGTYETIVRLQTGEHSLRLRIAGRAGEAGEMKCALHVPGEVVRWPEIRRGETHARSIRLSNRGGIPCSATLALEGEGFAISEQSVAIAPGSYKDVVITWRPTSPDPASGRLHVTSGNDAWLVVLEGKPIRTCLEPSPSMPIDLGVLSAGCDRRELFVSVRNECSTDVTLQAAVFDATSPAIRLDHTPPLPRLLTPGYSSWFSVLVAPEQVGEHAATLRLAEDTGETTTIEILTTADAGLQTDLFVVDPMPRTDLLLVIDDSAAMAPHQAKLQSLLSDLAAHAIDEDVLIRFGVTTTSRTATADCAGAGADGRLLPLNGPRWLDSHADLPSATWEAHADVGTCSSAPNEGMAAAFRALSELAAVADDPAHPEADDGNAGFLRPGAWLSLLFVSASDDASGEDAAEWGQRLLAVRGPRNPFFVGAIVPGCGSAPETTRYAELARWAGGRAVDLCVDDWTAALFGSVATWTPPRTHFYLARRPRDADGDGAFEDDIEVRLNGAIVPSTGDDGTIHWSFHPELHDAVIFASGWIPNDGATVEIAYTRSCPGI